MMMAIRFSRCSMEIESSLLCSASLAGGSPQLPPTVCQSIIMRLTDPHEYSLVGSFVRYLRYWCCGQRWPVKRSAMPAATGILRGALPGGREQTARELTRPGRHLGPSEQLGMNSVRRSHWPRPIWAGASEAPDLWTASRRARPLAACRYQPSD
jgi:hypothetical protein